MSGAASRIAHLDLVDITPIGQIGDSVVMRARLGDRPVIVKVSPTETAGQRARFWREVEALRRLEGCDAVPTLVQAASDDTRGYLIETQGPRWTLQQVLDDYGPMPWKVASAVCASVSYALHHAHVVGVIHRDVKPANILVGRDRSVWLIDFGAASVSLDEQRLVDVDEMVYSPGFTPPETYSGAPPTRAADVFSLGATLWATVSGQVPHKGRNDEDTIRRTVMGTRGRPPVVPPRVSRLLEMLMAVDPSERPASVADVGRVLTRLSR